MTMSNGTTPENDNTAEMPPTPTVAEDEMMGLANGNSEEPNPPLDTAELVLDENANPPAPPQQRPGLRRDNSVPSPAPTHLPPPAPAPPAPSAPAPEADQPPDSLSLLQLRGALGDHLPNIPKVEHAPYTFTYDDASSFEDELEEWFSYSVEEQAMLLKTHTSFSSEWSSFRGLSHDGEPYDWSTADSEEREEFVRSLLDSVTQTDAVTRLLKLEALVYILLGCWHETAGQPGPDVDDFQSRERSEDSPHIPPPSYQKSGSQIDLIRKNVQLFVNCGGLQIVVDAMKFAGLRACGVDVRPGVPRDTKEAERRELWCTMTAVYVVLEVARIEEKERNDLSIRAEVLSLQKPGLFILLMELLEKMRWDETNNVPLSKVFLLTWKTTLVSFGGLGEVQKAKDSLSELKSKDESTDARGQPIITASPLDYHLFRQEISSKYPAYNPPPPLFPLEPENNSILPPLKNHPNKVAGNDVFGSGLGNMNGNITSTFQQPIHIATPAPSPPPSPAGPGGKGGKKQNYQTNQMFPFLYPPLDEESNMLGGKGSTDLQDVLVGRKWEGSDIPASILEAAELFAKRMKATRAMKQLWEERVQFMKYERGWTGADDNADVDDLSLEPKEGDAKKRAPPPGSIEERMDLVEECYRTALPHLQSLAIMVIKALLAHVTALVTQTNGLQSGFQYQDNQNGHTVNGPPTNGVNGHAGIATNEELDSMRTQEILDKAVCGTLILLLKWFKVSHILKFEYLTQLLVDTSYVPLVLKLLQLQEIEKVVNSKCEQEELNFFYFCRAHSSLGIESPPTDEKAAPKEDGESDSDDALPPPIRMRRHEADESIPDEVPLPAPQVPETDELGNPLSDMPREPITDFSWRAFFTSINILRVMQKICKNKAHRNLMLVSYKSGQFLKKGLKVPQPMLRQYTLKLFKNQVPFCGRKWRQSNMRVITAVYLHCRPELRDDWLAGADVDAEVEDSVPLEQALRALTHWFNLKRYPESMGAQTGVLDEDQDFFRRELEKFDWGDEPLDGDADGRGWDVQVEGRSASSASPPSQIMAAVSETREKDRIEEMASTAGSKKARQSGSLFAALGFP